MPKKPENNKIIKDIKALNDMSSSILSDNNRFLNGEVTLRDVELDKIHSDFTNIIKSNTGNITSSKKATDSTYGYLTKSLFGVNANQDAKSQGRVNNLFNNMDAQVSSYFMGNNGNFMSMCDEIESICAYMYQLEEAIDVIRDNVLTSDDVSEDISLEFKFNSTNGDLDIQSQLTETVKSCADDLKIPKKLKDHIVPKAIKFGQYYVMVIPYSDIPSKIEQGKLSGSLTGMSTTLESIIFQDDKIPDSISKLIKDEIDKMDIVDINNRKDKQKELESSVTSIRERFKNITICEEATVPNIFDGIDEKHVKLFQTSMKAVATREKNKKDKGDQYSESVGDGDLDKIPGCHVKLIDPRQIVPVKIFDYVIGYYYFQDANYTRTGTSLTEMLNNQFNFRENNVLVNNIADSVIRNLKYADLLEGDSRFKNLILNAIMHKESINNPLKIQFIPANYIVEFKTNEDADGNGQPVLLRSLFYGRLYVSLLLFNITTIVTKSTDTEFYYLTNGVLDKQMSNEVFDIINQMQNANMDISEVVNGNVLHAGSAINKRYFMNKGINDIKPIEVDVVGGQKIDLYDELMQDLKKMAIGSTGVPSAIIDVIDEVDYATMLNMANIKHLKRCQSIQADFNQPITELYRKIAECNLKNAIDNEVLDGMKITLKKPKSIVARLRDDSMTSAQQTLGAMADVILGGSDTELTEEDKWVKEELIRTLVRNQTPGLPWSEVDTNMEQIILRAKERQKRHEILKEKEANASNDEV